MSSWRSLPIFGVVVAVLGGVGLAVTGGTDAGQGARIAAGLVTALAFVWLVRALMPDRATSGFTDALTTPSRPVEPRPPSLVRLERLVRLHTTAADVQRGIRPVLADLAANRLRHAHGIDLARDAQRARAVLGEELFDIVRVDRPVPIDPHAPGLARIEDVAALVERLESV